MLGHIAVSRAGGEQWAEALRLPSVRVIENGMEVPPLLDRTAVRAEVSHRYGVPEGVPLLVHIARFAPEKAHHVLIEALTRLRSAGYSFAVLMAGHGPDQASVEAAVTENHLEEVVQIVGAVPREDVWSLMRGADVCLLPSFNEGLPLVLVEAMFFETPIVATSVGGVRDMVVEGEMGYLVSPGDAAALAQALGAMLTLSTSERRALGQAARVRARRLYDIRHTATQHLDVFRRVVALAAARKNATAASHP